MEKNYMCTCVFEVGDCNWELDLVCSVEVADKERKEFVERRKNWECASLKIKEW